MCQSYRLIQHLAFTPKALNSRAQCRVAHAGLPITSMAEPQRGSTIGALWASPSLRAWRSLRESLPLPSPFLRPLCFSCHAVGLRRRRMWLFILSILFIHVQFPIFPVSQFFKRPSYLTLEPGQYLNTRADPMDHPSQRSPRTRRETNHRGHREHRDY